MAQYRDTPYPSRALAKKAATTFERKHRGVMTVNERSFTVKFIFNHEEIILGTHEPDIEEHEFKFRKKRK